MVQESGRGDVVYRGVGGELKNPPPYKEHKTIKKDGTVIL